MSAAYNAHQLAMLQHFDELREHTVGAVKELQEEKRSASLELFMGMEMVHQFLQKKHRKFVNHVLLDTCIDTMEEPSMWKCFEQKVVICPPLGTLTPSGEIQKNTNRYCRPNKNHRRFKKFAPKPSSEVPSSSDEESKNSGDSGVDVDSEPEQFTFKELSRKVKIFTPEEIQKQRSIVDEFKRKIQESTKL